MAGLADNADFGDRWAALIGQAVFIGYTGCVKCEQV